MSPSYQDECRCDRCEGRGPEETEPEAVREPKQDLCFECGAVLDGVDLLCPDCDEDERKRPVILASVERHDDPDDRPRCAQGYCCGCDTHPIGNPWGWNSHRWDEHYTIHHAERA